MKERTFKYYVTTILSETAILINYGRDDNEEYTRKSLDELTVKVGDTIEIFTPGPEVIDPISNKHLGFYDRVKDKLEIVEMHRNFSECRKIVTVTTSSPSFFDDGPLAKIRTEKIVKGLDVNKEQITKIEVSDFSNTINIGDPVRII